jgi:hypothetical protein
MKSLLWNSVVEIFSTEKQIEITEKLLSIKKSGNIFRITTNNPLLNQEFIFLDDKIKQLFHNKLTKIGMNLENIQVKYK